jgi:formylglycine-generating enzyme required for sulfatase activity
LSRLEAAFLDASLALRDRETAEKEQQEQQRLQAAEALAREQREKREAAEALAQEQKQRAEEQAAAAAGMRRRARVAVVIGILALVAAIVAIGAAIYAWRQTQQAEDRIAQVGQLVGDLGMERLLSMASQLDQAGDSDGAVTLLQTAVDLNLTLLVDLDASKLTTGTLRLLAEVSLIDKNGAKYAFVPAGAFTMGSDPAIDSLADSDEAPPHSVNLPGYWIGRVEVTNNQYA